MKTNEGRVRFVVRSYRLIAQLIHGGLSSLEIHLPDVPAHLHHVYATDRQSRGARMVILAGVGSSPVVRRRPTVDPTQILRR